MINKDKKQSNGFIFAHKKTGETLPGFMLLSTFNLCTGGDG